MERHLNSVGKACFVKYYRKFANSAISNIDLVDLLHKENGYTIFACNTRVSKARWIITNHLSCDALTVIISSQRLDDSIIAEAKKLFRELCS